MNSKSTKREKEEGREGGGRNGKKKWIVWVGSAYKRDDEGKDEEMVERWEGIVERGKRGGGVWGGGKLERARSVDNDRRRGEQETYT